MKHFIFSFIFFAAVHAKGQELYVYTDPASNIPANSISAKINSNFITTQHPYDRFMQRYTPEIMLGVNKKLMLRAGATFADMHTKQFRWESVYAYAKYRFLSKDELHSHFRMAAFAEAGYTRSPFHFDDVSVQGDKSGVQLGVIATQLWHKLAVSATVSHTQVLDETRFDKNFIYIPSGIFQVMSYSLSAGYLLLPFDYKDYRQTNVNLYTELLLQQSLDRKAYYADLAPAIQFIFQSNTKLNIGYRLQVGGDMLRMAKTSWQVSVERTFLNALKRKR